MELVTQGRDPHGSAVGEFIGGELGHSAEGHGQGDVLGAGTQAAFLAASVDDRLQLHAVAHVQCGGAPGGVHLVPDDGEQVHAQFLDAEADFPHRLGSGCAAGGSRTADGYRRTTSSSI